MTESAKKWKRFKWNIEREDRMLRKGACILHLYQADNQQLTREDFFLQWNNNLCKIHDSGWNLVVLRDNDWLNDHLVPTQSKQVRQWFVEGFQDEQFHVHFVSWRDMRVTIDRYATQADLLQPKDTFNFKTQPAVQVTADLPLSGYTIGVYWSSDTTTVSWEDHLVRFGANILHLYPTDGQSITRNDFLTWLDVEVRRVYATGSTLFILDNPHRSIPNNNLITSWLREKEEEEWFGDGREEHLHIRFVKCNTIKDILDVEVLVDSWGEVIERRKTI
eukprot:scaffold176950_cov21-Cyclotella_meneghiniana.AAC.1